MNDVNERQEGIRGEDKLSNLYVVQSITKSKSLKMKAFLDYDTN